MQEHAVERLKYIRELRRLKFKACKKDVGIGIVLGTLGIMAHKIVGDEHYLEEDIFQDMFEMYVMCGDEEFMRNIYHKCKHYAINRLRSKKYRYASSNKSANRLGIEHVSGDATMEE